jgi:hypothetical protein
MLAAPSSARKIGEVDGAHWVPRRVLHGEPVSAALDHERQGVVQRGVDADR